MWCGVVCEGARAAEHAGRGAAGGEGGDGRVRRQAVRAGGRVQSREEVQHEAAGSEPDAAGGARVGELHKTGSPRVPKLSEERRARARAAQARTGLSLSLPLPLSPSPPPARDNTLSGPFSLLTARVFILLFSIILYHRICEFSPLSICYFFFTF